MRAALLAALFFVGVAPTLDWLEFSSGSENLVVGTVLEMHRGGPWLIPTLKGMPRTTKPPLTNWLCAGSVSPASVTALSDTARRDAAYRKLAWQVRWPALLAACLTVVATAWLGRVLGGDTVGLAAAAMTGSSVMFLRFGRAMTTDVQLAWWVGLANVFLALAVLKGCRWRGCILGGLAIGLALMSKGPVALAQTVLPVAAFVAWRRWRNPASARAWRVGWAPVVAGVVAALAVALPWPLWVVLRRSGQIEFWFREVAQGGRADYGWDPPWVYLALLPLLLPWAGFVVLGLVRALRERSEEGVLAAALLLLPIVVMCCVNQKNDRYLLPMLAPAAVIAAMEFVRGREGAETAHRWVVLGTWAALLVIAVGVPMAGATVLERADGGRWWSVGVAAASAGVGVAVIAAGWFLGGYARPRGLIPGGVVLMLGIHALFMHGYAASARGLADGRPVADAIAATLPPDTEVWCYQGPGRFSRVPVDTTIYLNRTVRQAVEPTTLPTTAGGNRVVLVHRRRDQPVPVGMADWKVIGKTRKNAGTWEVRLSPPK